MIINTHYPGFVSVAVTRNPERPVSTEFYAPKVWDSLLAGSEVSGMR